MTFSVLITFLVERFCLSASVGEECLLLLFLLAQYRLMTIWFDYL